MGNFKRKTFQIQTSVKHAHAPPAHTHTHTRTLTSLSVKLRLHKAIFKVAFTTTMTSTAFLR